MIIVPPSGASTVIPRTETIRGLFGSKTAAFDPAFPGAGVQLDRDHDS